MKIDRLMGILTLLIQKEQVTAPQLSERFEVSRRTIGRDIDALCQAGIPVITRQGNGGGISIAQSYKLDKSILTSDELSNLIAALKGIGSISEKSSIERTLDKLTTEKSSILSLQEPIIIDLGSHYKGSLTKKIQLIKQAILENRLIKFDYYYEKGITHRSIEPCFVIFQWNNWYVFGFCLKRQDFRMFKLTRTWNLHLCEETYLPREIPLKKRDFTATFPDTEKLIALFEPTARYQLIETYGLDCFTETEQGKLRLETGFTHQNYIVSWLLGFGSKVTVLEPDSIAKILQKEAEKILCNYKADTP